MNFYKWDILQKMQNRYLDFNVQKLRMLDIELIRSYMPEMNAETKARAEKTIAHLTELYL